MNRYGDPTNSVQNLHPVKVLKGMMREGSEETRQWQGDPEGERELLRTGAQQLPLKNPAQLLGSNRPSGRLALICHDLAFGLCARLGPSRALVSAK